MMKKTLFKILIILLTSSLGIMTNAQQNLKSNVGTFGMPISDVLSFEDAPDDLKKIVYCGENLSNLIGEFTDNVSWELSRLEKKGNKSILSGNGNTKTNYVFKKPGDYRIDINENLDCPPNPEDCNHNHFPPKMYIRVSPVKMEFDFSTIKFSKDIVGNQPVTETTLTVDVHFYSHNNSKAVYDKTFRTYGIGTTIMGKLKSKKVKLKQGLNTLEFQLEGQATKDTYIMIDFVDINGIIQSYGLQKKIQ